MIKSGSLTMSEVERAKVVEAYANGEMKATVAALRLQISTRQLRRLRKRFGQDGLLGIASGRRGLPSNHQLAAGLAQRAVQVVRDHYADFGPTLACEMLRQHHGVDVSKETLRQLMIDAGIWTSRNARKAVLHQPRERRPCLGELVQIDGSRHAWFEDRRDACTVLVFIDDATSQILQLYFAESESTQSYFAAMQPYLERHGKPQAFYADRAAVFRAPAAKKHTPTQFQRALDELGITLICANSPQAKGRVERANRTLQDRLVKQLRTEKINDIDTANVWITKFIDDYNEQFSCAARSQLNLHTPLRKSDELPRILTLCETRKLSSKLTLQHGRQQYLLKNVPALHALIGQSIAIHTYQNGRIELRAGGKVLPYSTLKLASLARLEDVDEKTLHSKVDELTSSKRGPRPCRKIPVPKLVAAGVVIAKKTSAQKRKTAP